MSMQEYDQRYFYIFKVTDKTGSSDRSSSKAHSRSWQPNESEVSITVILLRKKQFSTTPNSKKVYINKCFIDGQPEVAVWLSKPEVLKSATVWEISLQFGRQTFYQSEFAKSTVTSMTTGNSDMTDKTGNSYTTGTTTNSMEITTASQVFLTIVSLNKVPVSDCDNVRQREMALRPLKPEILISLESYR